MRYQYLPIYLLAFVLLSSFYLGYTPPLISVVFLIASILAYVAYARDKSAAKHGTWRVSERSLHLISLLCGWPGAILAQQQLRHKTKKVRFRLIFWLCLFLNFVGVIWLHLPKGSSVLHSFISKLEYFTVTELGSNSVVRVILCLTQYYSEV